MLFLTLLAGVVFSLREDYPTIAYLSGASSLYYDSHFAFYCLSLLVVLLAVMCLILCFFRCFRRLFHLLRQSGNKPGICTGVAVATRLEVDDQLPPPRKSTVT
ncbi:hypothetical protein SH528x_006014 [Novipirellula sp. SH528]|uniref:hypothetical protein n=1 Tax=Novipirellula sp. SH528 TaxID=3454466 RepID=UPI003F9F076A